MSKYSQLVSSELAIKLEYKVPTLTNSYYLIKGNDCEVVSKAQKEIGQETGHFVPAPTYGEVLDWLSCNGVVIQLIPYFTYALNNRIGYDYILYKVNEDTGTLEKYPWNDFASFELCMKYAIEQAITLINK